jgi:hypothetical protein
VGLAGAERGLAEALALLAAVPHRHGRIGLELRDHARLGFPAGWLARLAKAGWELASAADDLWALRMVKDDHEVAAIRAACDAAAAGFRAVPGSVEASAIGAGVAETGVARAFAVSALAGGADEVGYVAVGSGPGGADSGVRRPEARRLASGDHLLVDAGVLVGGYWCDLNRNFAVGRPASRLRSWSLPAYGGGRPASGPQVSHSFDRSHVSAGCIVASVSPVKRAMGLVTALAAPLVASATVAPIRSGSREPLVTAATSARWPSNLAKTRIRMAGASSGKRPQRQPTCVSGRTITQPSSSTSLARYQSA